jgi:hypothetical protein
MEITARNVHEALPLGLAALKQFGVQRDSRNGPVMEMQEDVRTCFQRPLERVMFHRERDANPFFHFFESMWMLAGRNDVAFPARFVERMKTFSDDGIIFNGAYGFRWREHFGLDQLDIIASALAKNHDDRRNVLGMWDPAHDLGLVSKDLPCNLNCKFLVRADGKLHMHVDNRSNDIIWGLYGANAVHFSYLLEYMAARIGVPVGHQVHLSNNYHSYLSTFLPLVDRKLRPDSPYGTEVLPYEMMRGASWQDWDKDLALFFMAMEGDGDVFHNDFLTPFFREVVNPLWQAYRSYKDIKGEVRYTQAIALLYDCKAEDWRWACTDWLEQRYRRWQISADTGANNG